MGLAGAHEDAPTAWQPLAETQADGSSISDVLAWLPSVSLPPLASLEAGFRFRFLLPSHGVGKKKLVGAFCE